MEINRPARDIENLRVLLSSKTAETVLPRSALGEISNKLKTKKDNSKLKTTNPTVSLIKSGTVPMKVQSNKVDIPSKKGLQTINSKIGTKHKEKNIPTIFPKGINLKQFGLTSIPQPQEVIRKIDDQDMKDIFLLGRYVSDIYKYLLELEMKLPIRTDFLIGSGVTPTMRATLIDWLFDVQLHYSFLLETLHLSVAIIDRFIQNAGPVERKNFQLVGITAMFLACKFEETYYPEVSDFIYMTDNAYTKQQVLDLEKEIVSKLSFRLGRPISLTFLRRYSKIVQADQYLHTLGKYFIELALLEFSLAYARPSKVAAAAMYISMCIKENEVNTDLWNPTLKYYSTYSVQDFHNVTRKLANSIKEAPSSKYKSIRSKYSRPEFLSVSFSIGVQPDSPVLQKLSSMDRV